MAIRALYIHVPFCQTRCYYCDFYTRIASARTRGTAMDEYVEQICQSLRAYGQAQVLSNVETVYVGGGTPSFLGERLLILIDAIRSWCHPSELSVECNPESFNAILSSQLKTAGVTRLSFGVQSMVNAELKSIGRLHSAQGAHDALTCALHEGFVVSCDLMCGLPNQTKTSWRYTLDEILSLAPHHISVYPLSIEAGSGMERLIDRGVVAEPDSDFQATCMEQAAHALEAAGMHRYEVASYARSGYECQHNCAYWTGIEYLGLGPASASMVSAATYDHIAPLLGCVPIRPKEAARIRLTLPTHDTELPDIEFLTERQACAEDLMLAVRMSCGVSKIQLERAQRILDVSAFNHALQRIVEQGLGRLNSEGALVPTERGWLMGNELYGILWDLADA